MQLQKLLLLSTLSIPFAVGACADLDEGEYESSESEIWGWHNVTTSNAVGELNNGSCTATLIDSTTVLTAAHCVASCGGTPAARANFRLIGGTNIGGDVYVNPDHCLNNQINQGDYAIVKLDSPYPGAQPLKINIDSLPVGAWITYWGNGTAQSGPTANCTVSDDILRTTSVTIDNILSGNFSEWYQSYGTQGSGSCPGDSGGPATDTNGDIVGVASTGGAGGTSSYSTTAAIDWWLQDNMCPRVETGSTDWSLCNGGQVECQCSLSEGDCDYDSHCKPGLVCVDNIGIAQGIHSAADLCWDNSQVVTVYDGYLNGASRELVAGPWNVSDINNDSITSVSVPDGYAVQLWSESNFWGAAGSSGSAVMTSSATTIPSAMNNRTSSLEVLPAVTVFDYTNYTGEKETFTEGLYYVADFNVINNDDISALNAAPGVHVRLCSEQGWGNCQNFWGKMSLAGNSLNQNASSVEVSLGATVYDDIDFQGTSEAFKVGVRTSASFEAIANDSISSLIVAPGKTATLCKESNGTNCQTYTGHVPYVGLEFNDHFSYISIN